MGIKTPPPSISSPPLVTSVEGDQLEDSIAGGVGGRDSKLCIVIRQLPYKEGTSPVCDELDDEGFEVPFYMPIRTKLKAAIMPLEPCNAYVSPNGGYAFFYFLTRAEADEAMYVLKAADYAVEYRHNQREDETENQ